MARERAGILRARAGASLMRSMNGRQRLLLAVPPLLPPRRAASRGPDVLAVLGALRKRQHHAQARALSSRRTAPPCRRATAATRLRPRPVPGCGAALLQAHEALQDALAILRRNARAVIGHGDLDRLGPIVRDRMAIVAPLRRSPGLAEYLMALSTRLATAWLTSCAVGRRYCGPVRDVDGQRQAGLLGDRLVELGDVADERGRDRTRSALLSSTAPASRRAISSSALNVLIRSSASSMVCSRPSR